MLWKEIETLFDHKANLFGHTEECNFLGTRSNECTCNKGLIISGTGCVHSGVR